MALEIKLQKVGDSVGLILPDEMLTHLKVAEGDSLLLAEGAEGTVYLVSTKSEFARQVEIFTDLSRRYKNTLRELAK